MITHADVSKAIRDIRELHAWGRQALDRDGNRIRLTEERAAKLGISRLDWFRARKFAEEYDERKLNRLCNLIKRQIGKKGRAFGRTATICLMRAEKEARDEFQVEAIENCWSLLEMRLHIAERFGPRRQGGRRPVVASDEVGVLQQLEGLCERWRRWHGELEREDRSRRAVTSRDLPPGIARELARLVKELARLQRATTNRLDKLQSGRQRRKHLE